jgi:hypothetical protein
MKKQIINMSTTSLIQGMAPILVTVAAVLAVSALVAQPYSKSPQITRGCTDWPSDPDKPTVEAAFDKVLNDSATNKPLRDQLLDTRNCYKEPKNAVQTVLNSMPGKVKIPDDVLIIFYENDTPDFTRPHPPFADYPSDHCLHIFFLPPFGHQPVAKTSFRENLMCCYKPW